MSVAAAQQGASGASSSSSSSHPSPRAASAVPSAHQLPAGSSGPAADLEVRLAGKLKSRSAWHAKACPAAGCRLHALGPGAHTVEHRLITSRRPLPAAPLPAARSAPAWRTWTRTCWTSAAQRPLGAANHHHWPPPAEPARSSCSQAARAAACRQHRHSRCPPSSWARFAGCCGARTATSRPAAGSRVSSSATPPASAPGWCSCRVCCCAPQLQWPQLQCPHSTAELHWPGSAALSVLSAARRRRALRCYRQRAGAPAGRAGGRLRQPVRTARRGAAGGLPSGRAGRHHLHRGWHRRHRRSPAAGLEQLPRQPGQPQPPAAVRQPAPQHSRGPGGAAAAAAAAAAPVHGAPRLGRVAAALLGAAQQGRGRRARRHGRGQRGRQRGAGRGARLLRPGAGQPAAGGRRLQQPPRRQPRPGRRAGAARRAAARAGGPADAVRVEQVGDWARVLALVLLAGVQRQQGPRRRRSMPSQQSGRQGIHPALPLPLPVQAGRGGRLPQEPAAARLGGLLRVPLSVLYGADDDVGSGGGGATSRSPSPSGGGGMPRELLYYDPLAWLEWHTAFFMGHVSSVWHFYLTAAYILYVELLCAPTAVTSYEQYNEDLIPARWDNIAKHRADLTQRARQTLGPVRSPPSVRIEEAAGSAARYQPATSFLRTIGALYHRFAHPSSQKAPRRPQPLPAADIKVLTGAHPARRKPAGRRRWTLFSLTSSTW
jgi:hypothetical protein